MKKVLSLILSILLIASVVPMGLFSITASAEKYTSGYYTYTVSNGNATITDVDTSISGAVTIPSTLGGYPVAIIGYAAFYKCSSLKSITIPNSVTSIGFQAFAYCSSLTSITIPDSVTSIGNDAFYNTGYYSNSSNWKNNVLYIGKYLIEAKGSIFGTYAIKQGTLTIANFAFYNCSNLTSITIPDSVTSISYSAFEGCSSLTSITVDSANKHYSSQDGVLFNKDKTQLIRYLIGKASTTYTIPDSVTSIGFQAFAYCSSLKSITIPDSVTSIGGSAFYNCSNLTSITIPDSVTSIGSSAFEGCSDLTSITLPFVGATPDGISNTHFGYIFGANSYSSKNYVPSSLKEVIITASCKSIGNYAFWDCESLTSITIPDSVTSIGDYAFSYCSSLTSITIPDSVTSISDSAFKGCTSLTSITIGDSVTSIGGSAFEGCSSLTSITIPDSVTSIGNYAFSGCTSLTSITIPNSVTSIGNCAFSSCTGLTSITIPDSVTSIGNSAFYGCTSLESITLPFVGQNADGTGFSNFGYIFGAVDESYPYYRNPKYVPSSLKNVIITGSSSISENAFYGCSNLQNITFCGDVKIFADWIFNDCTGLKKVTLPASLTKIGSMAFYDCINLEDVYFLGAESQKNIQISHGNDMLEDVATWHYKSCYGSDQHSYSDGVICSVCGALKYTPGDIDGVEGVTDRDAVYLLYHTFLSDIYPVNQDCDFNGDGEVNDKDAVYLLYYTFLPDLYPIN